MGNNYIEMRLEDCMDAIIDYRGKTPKKVDNGIPLITAKIIKNGRIQEVNEFIAINDYDDWMVRGLPLEGDVVLTTEAPLGEVAQLDSRKVALAQRVITLRGKKGILENDYLLYLLQSSFVQNQLDGRASGSTVTGIKQSELREIILRLPPVSLQKSISHQLKCLDKKIDLNNKINKTLEQMSQTLFKSWFVDFDPVIDNALDAGNPIPEALQTRAELRQKVRNSADFKPLPAEIRSLFPNKFEETELGWVPKYWFVTELGKLITVKRGGSPRPIHDFLCNKGLPWVKISDATASNSRFINLTKDFIKTEGLNKTVLLKKGSLILSNSATPGLPKFLDIDACIHDGWLHFPKKKRLTDIYLYNLFLEIKEKLISQGNGSVFTNLKTDILKDYKIAVPGHDIISYFDKISRELHNKIHSVTENINTLVALRDTLLPKLISGELSLEDLPDLNTDTEAA
ncbi:restriction endonuclease subunit S [Escherichia albertii NBRC 107761 = DSM 17582]|uniref:Type I restriction modification DNA specificity domain protein n=1 Tax=Escherichia albertii (strain TW07627) TaxID=502347 RepID=A0ABC9NMX2_ESCAT|nr:restriction endonuclease subunit S [Escherichia albertii]EDS91605.1 type I restriction modification DNA specificity domain protein [Escherichia albertii TW07627]EEW3326855.1 restriction endonuclease subunit S [Escherichia albertii]EJM9605332.1 restriction endonuclease subunit S [Escherichia albertii]EKG0289485.1 restriction endonuclease subunit S [Escherichia albertii]MCJ2195489.1 restriction endonuclease subunit S [Escherichia albertii NBRC 107761 = DSM 17582]